MLKENAPAKNLNTKYFQVLMLKFLQNEEQNQMNNSIAEKAMST